jgi:methionyl aminopeptidase
MDGMLLSDAESVELNARCVTTNKTMKKHLKSYQIVSQVLKEMAAMANPGVTAKEIDEMAASLVVKLGGTSYNKGYKPAWAKEAFPASTCISVNDVVCHGIPDERPLVEGDLVNLDLGVRDSEGNCGDAGFTVAVGTVANKDERLMRYTKKILYAGIEQVKAGVSTMEITQAIYSASVRYGYPLNRNFGGHTIGKEMHMAPNIYNTIEPHNQYADLVEGQIICIEPMATHGKDRVGFMDDNGWTIRTQDGKNCAMYEHMVRVEKDGYTILTDHFTEES